MVKLSRTQYDNSLWCSLGRYAPCCHRIKDQKPLIPRRAPEILPVRRPHLRTRSYIELQRLVRRPEVPVEMIQHDLLVPARHSHDLCMILWRKDQRHRKIAVIICHNFHPTSKLPVINNKSVRIDMEIDNAHI